MKKLLLITMLSALNVHASQSFNYSNECSSSCRMAIFASAHELDYHSGWSASFLTNNLIGKCSQEKGNPLQKGKCLIPKPQNDYDIIGTIEYAIQASCIFEEYKESCGL